MSKEKVTGLSSEQAAKLLQEHGPNKLEAKKKKSFFMKFLDQFKDAMIIILLAAAAISTGVAIFENNMHELFEPGLILLIVIANALLGVSQESKAENALEALKGMTSAKARVMRDGSIQEINTEDVVPGDIVLLAAGDIVPADGILQTSNNIKCIESALTGESVPVDKDANAEVPTDAPIGDKINMCFSGCSVTYGIGSMLVTATGMKTEMGKIAGMLDSEDNSQTPLQLKLEKLGKYLGLMAISACVVIFIIGYINAMDVKEIFMTSVSLAVSAIPEGLPAIVTVVLSIGVTRMANKKAIIRKLHAVETLGSTSIICSDKTGTLTQNKMTVVQAWTNDAMGVEDVTEYSSPDIENLMVYGTLCSDGEVKENGEQIGDPTETSIIQASLLFNNHKANLYERYPRVGEVPFDSDRKMMSTIHEVGGQFLVVTKGAFDSIAKLCVEGNVDMASRMNEQMSNEALRVITVAIKYIDNIPKELTTETVENNLHLVGLIGMIDPPREEVKDAIKVCREAGIKPIMITGDHVTTASAIAKQIGIKEENDLALMGVELDAMSEEELDSKLESISVYARVSPENKIRIVKAWKKKNKVVAMTGDGVNDAPALKAADIGCAMGITGTDVAKGVSDMILTDDNFSTIVSAVNEGRGIYENIKRVVGFLLGTNIGEVILVFASMLLWHKSPLASMQLLWINLVTDSLPAVALGMEPVEKDIMKRKPKSKDEGLFANGYGVMVGLMGLMFGLLSLVSYYYGYSIVGDDMTARTMAFITLGVSQIVHAFNMRSDKSIFKIGPFTNTSLNKASMISLAGMLLVLFTGLKDIFGLIVLTTEQYAVAFGLCLVPLVVMEIKKAVTNRR